jgi:hypothetical protein
VRISKPARPEVIRASIVLVSHLGQGGRLMIMVARLGSGGSAILSVTGGCRRRSGDGGNMRFRVPESVVNAAHIPK